jgi:hypothetical protein
MAKGEVKTKVNAASVTAFLDGVADGQRRSDCQEVLTMMKQVVKEEPKMWGASIVGFGSFHYKGKSGREGDWMLTGFSPRKAKLTVYIIGGFEAHAALLKKLGKCTTSMGCLYLKKLDDVDRKVLKALIQASVNRVKEVGI